MFSLCILLSCTVMHILPPPSLANGVLCIFLHCHWAVAQHSSSSLLECALHHQCSCHHHWLPGQPVDLDHPVPEHYLLQPATVWSQTAAACPSLVAWPVPDPAVCGRHIKEMHDRTDCPISFAACLKADHAVPQINPTHVFCCTQSQQQVWVH